MQFSKIPGRKAPIIAVVGSDGSGKSTVSEELLKLMSSYRPTALCHLGKQTGKSALDCETDMSSRYESRS